MTPLAEKHQKVLGILLEKGSLGSAGVYKGMIDRGGKTSLVTVKRTLAELASKKLLIQSGSGRSTVYTLSPFGRLSADVDARAYCAIEPDRRYGLAHFNFDILPAIPAQPFTDDQMSRFESATKDYARRSATQPETIRIKELQRFIIELSWKSSKIEGNTYSLLDTEKLILEHKTAAGHDPQEATMILNHKDAFDFLMQNRAEYKTLTRANLEELHRHLTQGLSVSAGLRAAAVGVTGSLYRPLDNRHQIQEAVESLAEAVSRMSSPFGKALTALLGISYIQPFEDGNKRTARLMANGLLLAHGAAPLSYRSVDENEYREAMLTFYELNAFLPFRDLFVAQYEFAARNYAIR